MIVSNEPLTAWNVAALTLISVGCVATRRHEEEVLGAFVTAALVTAFSQIVARPKCEIGGP